ncbi:UDP-N-acetylmuramoyl-tripeptide--D-alanyl-D-alanine ligase [Vogesella indigofera]|uniref:UDP-N-acetylmuramoyl-tripeptide--D-alanyl-D-alanine ligase n=1 Tax=Vogesella indigofera TaxID=45465 RepID=A0A495BG84_VOGIN|nr:UDP-N-acetylmuramoyl-tripeptide--D-alanyl-D-alanine ligase [Vogesella indigofera]RKQ60097.1 UDP-N-acetylmuramoyl-tripeptide--D-alanyl-D-alanine ligase [Vogesella indigofera]
MLPLSDAARLLSGELAGSDAVFQRVVTDSRAVQAGDLFVALKGDNFDAHDFVAEVLAKGAFALVRHDFEPASGSVIRVADTRLALGTLAAAWCARLQVKRIGITGSNGKTTVKEMVAAILRAHAGDDAVHATVGNFNNDIGLPLTLLALRPAHRYAVIEMGMNHFGEIRYLTSLARPQVALVNNAMRAHLGGGFDSTADIARAKSEIFEGLSADGVAIINADDAQQAIFTAAAGQHRQLRFGLSAAANVSARDIVASATGNCFTLVCPQGEQAIELPAAGEHNVRNALAAAAVALALDVPLAAIAAGLAAFAGVKGRLQLKPAACGATVIDDSYNANPDSMKAGIDVLAAYPAPRIFVMGQIGELGDTAPQLHAEVGTHARARGIETLLCLGELAQHAAAAYGVGAEYFDDIDALLARLDAVVTPASTVLVKGSRFMRMERVVAHLVTPQQQENGKG